MRRGEKMLRGEVGLWGFMRRGCLKKRAKHSGKEYAGGESVVRIRVRRITEAVRVMDLPLLSVPEKTRQGD